MQALAVRTHGCSEYLAPRSFVPSLLVELPSQARALASISPSTFQWTCATELRVNMRFALARLCYIESLAPQQSPGGPFRTEPDLALESIRQLVYQPATLAKVIPSNPALRWWRLLRLAKQLKSEDESERQAAATALAAVVVDHEIYGKRAMMCAAIHLIRNSHDSREASEALRALGIPNMAELARYYPSPRDDISSHLQCFILCLAILPAVPIIGSLLGLLHLKRTELRKALTEARLLDSPASTESGPHDCSFQTTT